MRTNAPEKLYLDATSKCGDTVFTIKNNDTDIEYTRADVFIEKACDWLEKNGCGYWLDDSALPNRDLIEDFRKYMEE